MTPINAAELIKTQYHTSVNLDARIRLHQRFSTNPMGWLPWVFDQLALPAQASILEIGCGTGQLWAENLARIPAGWELLLTDQSPGMLQQTQQNLAKSSHPFRYEVADAQALPYVDGRFDAVIANHMLYHVPDLQRALAEIRRVLKPGRRLYAATNGDQHMAGLASLTSKFDPRLEMRQSIIINSFRLENGGALLDAWFAPVELRHYEDDLIVTDAEALVDYVFSMMSLPAVDAQMLQSQRAAFLAFVQQEMKAQGGAISIQKETGLFIATKMTG